jgi:DeoR family transcriptional regulator, aga operon transcriptional repressor
MDLRNNAGRRQRFQKIISLLSGSDSISVDEMCASFGVSPSTIRRDLGVLETQGLLRREHGGAISLEPLFYEAFSTDSSFQEQVNKESAEKKRIGMAAAAMIKSGETIAISAGTTTTQVARCIPMDMTVTLFTNAVNMAMEFGRRSNLTVSLTGGVMRGAWFSLVGPGATESAQKVNCDRLFLGVNGISVENGLTDFHQEEAAVNRVFWERARKRIVVADHTKFSIVASNVVASLNLINTIITGVEASEDTVQPFIDRGIEVRRV